VVAGVAISITTAVHDTGGHFRNGVERGFNTFAFFTIQSNLIVGLTSAFLALRERPATELFRVVRLIGLVAITVTGIVYHVALAHLFDLESWSLVGDQLVHTVVPLLAVAGWLLLGPRGLTSVRVAWLSLVFPLAWLGFTLVRGAVVHWYPYPLRQRRRARLRQSRPQLHVGVAAASRARAGAAALDRRLRPASA
jgi:hypothetical protein